MTRDSKASVRRARALFEQMARRAETPLVVRVRHEFERILKRVKAGGNEHELEPFVVRAGELARMRAYVIPGSEIASEGSQRIEELVDWGVPAEVIDKMTRESVPDLTSTDEGAARVALHAIYEQYDYWDWYVEVYEASLRKITTALLVLIVAALSGAGVLLYHQYMYAGIVCAGVAGASVGIFAKLPRAITASVMGSGLLPSDIVSVRGKRQHRSRIPRSVS